MTTKQKEPSIVGEYRWKNKYDIPVGQQRAVFNRIKQQIDQKYPLWSKRTKYPKHTFVVDFFIMEMERIEDDLEEKYKQAWNEFVMEHGDKREDGTYVGYLD